MNGLALVRFPGQTWAEAIRARKAGYQRDYRRKLREKHDTGIPVSKLIQVVRQPGILQLRNVKG